MNTTKIRFLFLLLFASLSAMAQHTDTSKMEAIVKRDTSVQRVYKVDMVAQQKDTTKAAAPNFLQPYSTNAKRLESNYQYNDGQISGGSTKLKLGKNKKN